MSSLVFLLQYYEMRWKIEKLSAILCTLGCLFTHYGRSKCVTVSRSPACLVCSAFVMLFQMSSDCCQLFRCVRYAFAQ